VSIARWTASELRDLDGTLDAGRVDGAVRDTGDQSIAGTKSFVAAIGTPKVDHGTQGGTVSVPALHVLWTLQPIEPGTAKWQGTCGTAFFGLDDDQVHYHGYNADESVPTEPRVVRGTEVHYVDPATGRPTVEGYFEFRSPAVGGPSPRIQRRAFAATIDEATGSVDSADELGPAGGPYGHKRIRGGASNGGDFDIQFWSTGDGPATSITQINSPLTVQRATTLQSTLSVTGAITSSGIVNLPISGVDGAYAEVFRTQIAGNIGVGFWRNSIESTISNNAINSGWRLKCSSGQTTQNVVLTVNGLGNATIAGGLSVGGGGTISKILPASATLAFPQVAAAGQQELTISVTGATVGTTVAFGPPASLEPGLGVSARVSAADTVTVRLINATDSPITPASATYRVVVFNQ